MSGQWKPGDVALVQMESGAYRAIVTKRRQASGEPLQFLYETNGFDLVDHLAPGTTARPLVVIDPEDREQVKRLVDVYDNTPYSIGDGDAGVSEMQAALREFANPTPPKPEEPRGVAALVADAGGDWWARLSRGADGAVWHRIGLPEVKANWRDIEAVEVLSEGVTP